MLLLAFDISEFSHLIVQVPQLHDDRTLVILIMLFSSASTLLLLQMDLGLGMKKNRYEIAWHCLTILLLDIPFLVIRIAVMASFPDSIETFQLVYLLKNAIGILYGIVRIIRLYHKKPQTEGQSKSRDKRVEAVAVPAEFQQLGEYPGSGQPYGYTKL